MFSLFKKKNRKLKVWENTTFFKLFNQLGGGYEQYCEQLNFIEKVGINRSDIPNLINFIYPISFYKIFGKQNISNFKLEGLIVKDVHSSKKIVVTLYFAENIFLGYSSDIKQDTFEFDVNNIFYENIKKKIWGDEGLIYIKKYFTDEELKYVNIGEIFVTDIKQIEYFHLKELEDGDFLGINRRGNFYIITHDPLEVKEVDRESAIEILKIV